jgi:hypothetical protein
MKTTFGAQLIGGSFFESALRLPRDYCRHWGATAGLSDE